MNFRDSVWCYGQHIFFPPLITLKMSSCCRVDTTTKKQSYLDFTNPQVCRIRTVILFFLINVLIDDCNEITSVEEAIGRDRWGKAGLIHCSPFSLALTLLAVFFMSAIRSSNSCFTSEKYNSSQYDCHFWRFHFGGFYWDSLSFRLGLHWENSASFLWFSSGMTKWSHKAKQLRIAKNANHT